MTAPKVGDLVVVVREWVPTIQDPYAPVDGLIGPLTCICAGDDHPYHVGGRDPVWVHEIRPATPEEQAGYWLDQGGAA